MKQDLPITNEQTRLAIIGWGNQAKAWAMNWRDSGYRPVIFLRPSSSSQIKAQELGFTTKILGHDTLDEYQACFVGIPDHEQQNVFDQFKLSTHPLYLFAHGYALTRHHIDSQKYQCALLAPKAIASELRFQYETQGSLGAFYSVDLISPENKEVIELFLLTLAKDLGISVGPFRCTIHEETQADLFSEQSLLCSLVPWAALKSYEKLCQSGIPPRLAYFECWYELKLIVDALVKLGPEQFFKAISPNALYGASKGIKLIQEMNFERFFEQLWDDLKAGEFYSELDHANTEASLAHIQEFWEKNQFLEIDRELRPQLFHS